MFSESKVTEIHIVQTAFKRRSKVKNPRSEGIISLL